MAFWCIALCGQIGAFIYRGQFLALAPGPASTTTPLLPALSPLCARGGESARVTLTQALALRVRGRNVCGLAVGHGGCLRSSVQHRPVADAHCGLQMAHRDYLVRARDLVGHGQCFVLANGAVQRLQYHNEVVLVHLFAAVAEGAEHGPHIAVVVVQHYLLEVVRQLLLGLLLVGREEPMLELVGRHHAVVVAVN